MTSERGVPRRRPPRPVQSAPVDALFARAEDLAKGWLLELLEQSPLEDAPTILAADLVRDGPALCGAIARALGDERDLRRLDRDGDLEWLAASAGELAGACGAEPSARAVDALRAVMWAAVREELDWPDADQSEALGERLAVVTDVVRAATLRRLPQIDRGVRAWTPVDELPAPSPNGPSIATVVIETVGEADHARHNGATHSLPADVLWRGALEDEVAGAQRSGAKLALLLAELHAGERVPPREPAHVASRTFGQFAQALRAAVRRDDILACETESRAWVIARATGRPGARALASRIAHAVREAEHWGAEPLTVGIGIAVFGEDAHDAVGLIDAADESAVATLPAGGADALSAGGMDALSAGGSDDVAADGADAPDPSRDAEGGR